MGNSLNKNPSDSFPEDDNIHVKRILEAREKLTGWERLKLIFVLNDHGEISPELHRIITATSISAVVGGLIGALGRGRIAHQDFMRSNLHEVFETPLTARRKLQDNVTLGMGSGAWRIGWRVFLFTGMYMVVSTAVSTYRGKMGITDQVIGAGVAGFLYKVPQSPKASIAGGTFGCLIGLSAGLMTAGITKLTGDTIDSASLRYYQIQARREYKMYEDVKESRELANSIDRNIWEPDGDPMSLSLYHDKLVEMMEAQPKEKNTNTSLSIQSSQKKISEQNNEEVEVASASKVDNTKSDSNPSSTKSEKL